MTITIPPPSRKPLMALNLTFHGCGLLIVVDSLPPWNLSVVIPSRLSTPHGPKAYSVLRKASCVRQGCRDINLSRSSIDLNNQTNYSADRITINHSELYFRFTALCEYSS